ncbi:MAG: FAD-dependent oxidoreductase [Burkholderiaceae bacterium]|nr:FAD-dependent oxidoreductase [Burkholderiaceae bacterium]
MMRISGRTDSLSVYTQQGRVACERLVLAANAWMAHLPEFHPHIAVVSSDIVATDPIPELLARRGMLRRPHGVNSRLMLNYGGITPDGRVYLGRGGGSIAFRGRIDRRFDYCPRQAAEVQADFRYLYPELDDVPITRAWAGPIDRATTGLPWFGRLEACSGVYYGIGYSGHGVGASALGGRILASMLLGKQDDWATVGQCLKRARRGRFPPEPVRFVGGHAVRAAVVRKEHAEREGRRPTRLDQALAALAPATISQARPAPK